MYESKDPLLLFNNGTLRNEINFKDMCPLKQKKQTVRVAFDQGWFMAVDNQTNEFVETGEWDMSQALAISGLYTTIPFHWEILKLFFTIHNIAPTWTDGKGQSVIYHQGNRTYSGIVGKVSIE